VANDSCHINCRCLVDTLQEQHEKWRVLGQNKRSVSDMAPSVNRRDHPNDVDQITCYVIYKAAVGTTWPLIGSHRNGQAVLHPSEKH
jgi:hypothetical protein